MGKVCDSGFRVKKINRFDMNMDFICSFELAFQEKFRKRD